VPPTSIRTSAYFAPLLILLTLTTPLRGVAQSSLGPGLVRITPTAGYMAYGSYFSGPAGLKFSNDDGVAYGGELAARLTNNFEVVGSALHATSNWSFQGIPLIGSIGVGGASLWFYDGGLRARFPLRPRGVVSPFVQLSVGAIRYTVDNALLSDHATNFTYSGGVGLAAQLGRRLSIQAEVKDYLASFKSVDQGAVLGIEGRRAHTFAFLIGAGIGL
jgi:hypothetical protein